MAKKPGAGGVILVALVLGVITAVLAYRWANELKKTSKENWKPVVTALVDIKPHTKVTREMIQVTPVPPELIAEGALTKIENVEGRITLGSIASKDQIRASSLAQEGQAPSLAFEVPPGMRAIAIEASEVAAVGTSVKPGDKVDVLATFHDDVAKQDMTKIILQNVQVLAVNRGETDPSGKQGASSSMTIAVKPEQAVLVTAASRAGALRVMLRAIGDDRMIDTGGEITVRELAGGRLVLQEARPTVVVTNTASSEPAAQPVFIGLPASRTARPDITIYRGTQEQTITPK